MFEGFELGASGLGFGVLGVAFWGVAFWGLGFGVLGVALKVHKPEALNPTPRR